MSGSSIGTIAGGVVGGIIGFFAGGNVALGATLGMAIGGAIGGALDPPKTPELKGPRLGDLSVQTSTYGAIIPRNYGVIAQYGNIFWLQNDKITEVEDEASGGGKGGMGKPKQKTTTYTYFATFAVGLCEGPIGGIKRIWIGSDLRYDAGATDIESVFTSNEVANGFKLYSGTETQLPDPSIQADKGIANTPAYRGLAYIVFNDLPLEDYNNSLLGAQIKVEIVKDVVFSDNLVQVTTVAKDTSWTAIFASAGNQFDNDGFSNYVVRKSSPTEPTWIRTINGNIVSIKKLLDNGSVASISTSLNSLHYAFTIFGQYACYGSNGHVFVYDAVQSNKALCDGDNNVFLIKFVSSNYYLVQLPIAMGGVDTGSGIPVNAISELLLPSTTNESCLCAWGAFALIVNRTSSVNAPFNIAIYSGDPTTALTLIDSFSVAFASNPGVAIDIDNTNCHADNNKLYISLIVSTADVRIIVIDLLLRSIIGDHIIVASFPLRTIALLANFRVIGNAIFWGQRVTDNNFTFYGNSWAINNTSGDAVTLAQIVQSETLNSQLLTSSDIDVTELTDIVRGYRVSSIGAIRGALEPLRSSWPFDVLQHGYKIKFKKRGSASISTIPASALDARSAGAKPGIQITNAREMDSILAKKVTIKYFDNAREYDTNQQYASRINTDAVNEISIEIPVVFNAQEAAQKAEVLLYLYWMERYDIQFVLPFTYANLEPGDVITVNGESAVYELRLTTLNTLPDGRIECRAKHSKTALYSPGALGEEGQSTGAVLTYAGPSAYELLDIPMMRDVDNIPGFPVAMTGYYPGWPGGLLYRSEDGGQTFYDIYGFTSPGATMGYATTTLSASDSSILDKSSTLAVGLYKGTLSSITEAQMFAGSNWFAYGADTRWEIIAAQKCVLQGNGSYILTDFLRGQNGTEWTTGLHIAYDKIILLDTAPLAFIASQSASIGVAKLYRGITAGKALTSDSNRSFIYNAVNLECLSPCAFTGNRHPTTNDWALTWTRRSRFAGWRDLIDAALGETTEAYEVDIFSSGTYATLKRTLTASTQTVAYTSANQVTDFGSNQATLYVKIYQLSATVGRGYPLIATITR